MKISELIPTLSTLMREIGDADVCIQVDNKAPLSIQAVASARNVEAPNTEEKINLAVLKALSST